MIQVRKIIAFIALLIFGVTQAQEKKVLDGVIAVVGEHIILESDIDKVLYEANMRETNTEEISRCNILGSILESRMFAHHAVQDSLTVSQEEIDNITEGQINTMVEQLGSIEAVTNMYGKSSVDELKKDLSKIIKTNRLASMKQNDIVKSVEITPEEVREYFKSIPDSDLPMVDEEYELSEITIAPKIDQAQIDEVINKLNEIKKNVEEGYSFSSQATLYTEDKGSIETGGMYEIDKNTQFVKEFKDVAFSLKEGEISEPFKTVFGYHIIYLEKIKGSKLVVRHILLSPKPTPEAIQEAKDQIEKLRTRILNKEITFADAARMYSDSKSTKASGGLMMYGQDSETRIPAKALVQSNELFYAVNPLEEGEISQPFLSQDNPERKTVYRIVELTNKIPKHKANFEDDYMAIREQALLQKQRKAIQKWINQKVFDTYIFISDEYKNCDFSSNWLKKQDN